MSIDRFFILLLLFLFSINLKAQTKTHGIVLSEQVLKMMEADSTQNVQLGKIIIQGNRRTRSAVILREMQCSEGDKMPIHQLLDLLKESRDLIYNTNLFSTVEIHPIMVSDVLVDVDILVIERIYFYPAPEFRLSDRNFNEWWKTYHADLGRITYGIKLKHNNVSGRGDKLSVYLLNGFARNISLNYSTPYINKEMTRGFAVGFGFTQQKEYPLKTSYYNKLLSYRKEDYSKTTYSFNATYICRNGFYRRNYWSAQLTNLQLPDSLFFEKYNPDYLLSKSNQLLIPDVSFTHQYIQTDNVNYPLKGTVYQFSVVKRGFGWNGDANMASLDILYKRYFPLGKNWYGSVITHNKLKLPFKQAYINRGAFGYGDYYLRGLEEYVIDGVATTMNKFTVSKKFLSVKIKVPFKNRYLPFVPLDMFLKTYGDLGCAHLPSEQAARLNNKLLYTGGIGLDLLSVYDTRFSFEYSLNQLGEKGLFLHLRSFF